MIKIILAIFLFGLFLFVLGKWIFYKYPTMTKQQKYDTIKFAFGVFVAYTIAVLLISLVVLLF